MVRLSPLVAAELLSAPLPRARRAQLASFLGDLPLHPTPFEHWDRVGALRRTLARRGVAVSIPDAHVAQCALDDHLALWSLDKVFVQIARVMPLRLVAAE